MTKLQKQIEKGLENIKDGKYCQDCKFQKNKPSTCFKFIKTGKPTPRKDVCSEWTSKRK